MLAKNHGQGQPVDKHTEQSILLAISAHQLVHLCGTGNSHDTSYGAAVAVVQALEKESIPANISAGGISFSVNGENVMAATRTLATLGIDIEKLDSSTFDQ